MINSIFSRMAIGMMVAAQILVSCSKDNNNEPNEPNEPAKVGEHGEVLNDLATQNGYMVLKGKGFTNGNWHLTLGVGNEALINTVWADLNNNGKKDTGETFNTSEKIIRIEQKVESEVITIYGAVNYLKCNEQQLTVLDVSHNPSLTELECNNNQLTTLEVSQNTKLTSLTCYKNNLDEANMTKLVGSLPVNEKGKFYGWAKTGETNYRGDNLKDLFKKNKWVPYIGGERWFGKFASKYGVINQEEAESVGYMVLKKENIGSYWNINLDIGYDDKINQEIWVDLNNNGNKNTGETFVAQNWRVSIYQKVQSEVIVIYGRFVSMYIMDGLSALEVSNNSKLKKLVCEGSSLTDLDVSENVNLIDLFCGRNQLATLNLSNNTELLYLSCEKNNFNEATMKKIINSLPDRKEALQKGSFNGWVKDGNNYKGNELKDLLRAKGWIPMHRNGSKWEEWK